MARFLGIVLLVAAAVPVCVPAASAGGPRHPAVARPAVLVWGDGLFAHRDAFAHWLGRHGQAYATWAAAHPVGREILTRPRIAPFARSQLAPVRTVAPVVPLPATSGSGGFPVLILLAAAGAMLLMLGIVPLDRVARSSTTVVLLHERRVDVVAAGLAILVGVAVAKLAT